MLCVLAGLRCLHPLRTVAALSRIVGTVWLVSGILNMPHRGLVKCVAVLAVVAEIAVLAPPAASTRTLTRLLVLGRPCSARPRPRSP